MLKKFRVLSMLVVLTVLAALLLSACGDTPTATTAATARPATTTAAATTAASAATTTAATSTGTIPTSGGFLDTIKQRGKLVVGVKYDTRLFGYNNPQTKQIEGIDADIARELAKGLLGDASKIELVEAVSANRIPFLQQDKVDLILSTMTITEERKGQIDFSDVYYVAGQSILVPSNSTITGVADLNGKTVTSVQGTTSEKNITDKAPSAQKLLFKTHAECFEALKNGQADAYSTDDIILLGWASTEPGKFKLVGGQFTTENYGIGIKKGRTELQSYVNGTLAAMKADGRWKAIYDKHIKPITGSSAEPPK
jgi:aspartate/glutamate/glutamine transport system substrate-binding protein